MRILVWAYACEPDRGSEPGAGWLWARMLAHLGDICVITRSNNAPAIDAALPQVPERDRLEFRYVDLPPWARRWKRGRRGIHVYYFLWQLAALREARKAHRDSAFDLVWHLTLANVWFGSMASMVGPRFVYGPVGGGATAPLLLLPVLGPQGAAYELLRSTVQRVARYGNPLGRVSWRRAQLILTQNEETRRWIPARYRDRVEVFPNVVLDPPPEQRNQVEPGRPPVAMYAGELRPLKGVALAIHAVALLPRWRLLIFGSGPDEPRLRRLTGRLGLQDRVEFRGFVPRERLLSVMSTEADVLIFPSLRDQAGWVVAEASSVGLPVVCLANGGPPLLGGTAVESSTPGRTAAALARTVDRATRSAACRTDFEAAVRCEQLAVILAAHGLRERG